MFDVIRASVQGFVKIIDKETGEVLVDTHNDVLYGNLSVALAHALIGNPNSFLFYMGFGNGGAYVGTTGSITYKPSLGGAASLTKNPTANLYNTIFVKKVSNDSTDASNYTPLSKAYIPTDDPSTNYEDIVVDVTLDFNEPPYAGSAGTVLESTLDNSTFVGSTTKTDGVSNPNSFVFNEIALYAGSDDVFPGNFTATTGEVTAFINQGPDFSINVGAKSKLMITHVIFHPVQKSANRKLQIIYTLRIQMGAL
jgi:hypothetical protein